MLSCSLHAFRALELRLFVCGNKSVEDVRMFANCLYFMRNYSCRSSFKRTDSIRDEFINYFKHRNHKMIRSSPVVPFCDPSVTFVNAGMNQFKGVLLGSCSAPAPRVVNSQKCIRVGGKHNDLDVVGSDGYHHTFFEMLGSWSFGDYFKRDACRLAWEHLTKTFGLDPKRLYVTYFGGEEYSGLSPDLETKEIWLEIGVPESHVLPFGAKDNFWEMGPTGPCGPCTEIHYDFLGRISAAERVNAGYPDLIELWNIVFIQYERHEDCSLAPLPFQHVDTGMGLERLASVLQGVTSTYDTDAFQPLFRTIQKFSGAPPYQGKFGVDDDKGLDTGYRILADHSRMITVAVADGMLPDHNHRLRRVIRRALSVSKELFLTKGDEHDLLYDLCARVANALEVAYPGIIPRLDCIKAVLMHEASMLSKLHSESANEWNKFILERPQLAHIDVKSSPGIVKAFKELELFANRNSLKIDDEKAFELYDTYGLNEEVIKKLGDVLGLQFNSEGFSRKLKEAKDRSRKAANLCSVEDIISPEVIAELCASGVPVTNDEFKYSYHKDAYGNYHFEPLEATIKAIIIKGELAGNGPLVTSDGEEFGLVLDRTCFYHESGGQIADKGSIFPINVGDFKMMVRDVQQSNGFIIHWGHTIPSKSKEASEKLSGFQVGDKVHLCIDADQRLNTMRNHTAVHCLGAAIRHNVPAAAQRSSLVSPSYFSYQFSVYGVQFPLLGSEGNSPESGSDPASSQSKLFTWQGFLERIEEEVRQVIRSKSAPVRRKTLNGMELLYEMSHVNSKFDEIATVPGEVYPESGVHLIEIMVPAICIPSQLVKQVGVELKRDETLTTWSREPCCGTHVLDVTDIQEFSIVDVESTGSGSRVVKAVTGPTAMHAKSKGEDLISQVKDLQKKIEEFLRSSPRGSDSKISEGSNSKNLASSLDRDIKNLFNKAKAVRLNDQSSLGDAISYVDRCKARALLEEMNNSLKESMKAMHHSSTEREMSVALHDHIVDGKFLVHCLYEGGSSTDKVLQKATRCCPRNLPVLLLAVVNGGKSVKARCIVPKELANEEFNAERWMGPILKIFHCGGSAPKGQDRWIMFNMRERKLKSNPSEEETKKKFDLAIQTASEFARKALSNPGDRSS